MSMWAWLPTIDGTRIIVNFKYVVAVIPATTHIRLIYHDGDEVSLDMNMDAFAHLVLGEHHPSWKYAKGGD